jgi:hypothetical protein
VMQFLLKKQNRHYARGDGIPAVKRGRNRSNSHLTFVERKLDSVGGNTDPVYAISDASEVPFWAQRLAGNPCHGIQTLSDCGSSPLPAQISRVL